MGSSIAFIDSNSWKYEINNIILIFCCLQGGWSFLDPDSDAEAGEEEESEDDEAYAPTDEDSGGEEESEDDYSEESNISEESDMGSEDGVLNINNFCIECAISNYVIHLKKS